MTALLLGGSWATLVLLAAARHRPPPPRARALATTDPATRRHRAPPRARALGPPPPATRRDPLPARPDVLAAVGRGVLRLLPSAVRPGPEAGAALAPGAATRALGATTVAVLATLVVAPGLVPVVVVAGWAAPRHRARVAERRRLRTLEACLPDTVDLLVLAVGAGCNVPLALAAAGRRGTGPLATELRLVSAEVERGRRLADALDDLPVRAGEPTRALAGVLGGCERYGTAVLPALQRLADDVRLHRQRQAEATARRVPVTLLFPLVLCILPAFALLTVAPLIAGALRELRP